MSKLKVTTISDPDNDNTALTIDSSGNVTASQGFVPSTQLSHRNLIINGNMQVAQRGTSGTANGYNSVDRFRAVASGFDELAITYSQDSDAPDGFSNSYKANVTTSETTVDDYEQLFIEQRIEAQNLQHLSFGTSSAKSITLSFWVKCSETGIATILLYQPDDNRGYCAQYTISSADTWEYKTLTVSGDTVGVIDNDNGVGLYVRFALAVSSAYTGGTKDAWLSYANSNEAVGQTVDVATTGGNFAITGVQLEVGSVATPFEHRSYGEELARCQRYFQTIDFTSGAQRVCLGFQASVGETRMTFPSPTTMRTTPTFSYNNIALREYPGDTARTITSFAGIALSSFISTTWLHTNGTSGNVMEIRANSADSYVNFDAEL